MSLEPQALVDVAESCVTVARACGVLERGIQLRDWFLTGLQAISDAVGPTDSLPGQILVWMLQLRSVCNVLIRKLLRMRVRTWEHERSPETKSTYKCVTASHGKSSAFVAEKKVFILEWTDPPFDSGNWVPEIIQVRSRVICCPFYGSAIFSCNLTILHDLMTAPSWMQTPRHICSSTENTIEASHSCLPAKLGIKASTVPVSSTDSSQLHRIRTPNRSASATPYMQHMCTNALSHIYAAIFHS